jgi:glycosyltransferase EpsE
MEIATPLVSIIIASYNSEKTIEKCLESLLGQTYNNIEIIVCDDNSTDNSFSVIETIARRNKNIIVLHNEVNLKAAASRNNCIAKAKGDFIAIQDADDLSFPNRIEIQVNYLLSHPDIDFVSCNARLFNDTLKDLGVMKLGGEHPSKYNFLWGLPFIHPATLFRKKCVSEVGGYRVAKETKRGQDYDMFMRMYAKGYRGVNLDQCLYWYRLDESCIKRHGSSAYDEFLVRKHGFKAMGLMPWGYLFAIKPYFSNCAHSLGWFKYSIK